jgi:hypothetical protein
MNGRPVDSGEDQKATVTLPHNPLRKKIGNVRLEAIFTAEKIRQCQTMVDDALGELLQEMETQLAQVGGKFVGTAGEDTPIALEGMAEVIASIKKRMESLNFLFGYRVAESLGDYIHSGQAGERDSLLIVCKHIAVLNLIIRDRIGGDGGDMGRDMLENLRELVRKGQRSA